MSAYYRKRFSKLVIKQKQISKSRGKNEFEKIARGFLEGEFGEAIP